MRILSIVSVIESSTVSPIMIPLVEGKKEMNLSQPKMQRIESAGIEKVK